MTKLSRSHPFIAEAFTLEELELKYGLTEEIINRKIIIASEYPEFYKEYMQAKRIKEEEKLYHERIEKNKEIKEKGCETISYYKNKIKESKRKNRLNCALNH